MQISSKFKALLIVGAIVLLAPAAGSARTRLVTDPVHATSAPSGFSAAPVPSAPTGCSSGAHTLSHFGDRVYPEMGNGGYTSLHTDVTMMYDAPTNLLRPGTKVDLTVRSTQCLSDLSFDFEQTNGSTAGGSGPNMTVDSVEVNGAPATFTFVQPTYPGDPNGQDDPNPLAHAVSNANPVSATNPNPPACSPQVNSAAQNGTQCPANKLVVTPPAAIPDGTTFKVTIDYTGRPGVHVDGDGSTEGWFRVNTTAAPNDGAFVTTEPVGTDSWMPLNNHPLAKPTYDFYDTTNIGKTAVANGEIVGFTPPAAPVGGDVAVPPTSVNPPDANFPDGSWTWHWHSPEPIANYLVENSIGGYDLTARTSPSTGIQYYEAQASSIAAARKATNRIAINSQEDIVEFQRVFDGPWPLTTDGVLVGIPPASFEEEMQGKITFAGGTIGGGTGTSLGTLNHENMHQWFGDNVAEAAFNLTFWKEGFATLGEYLNTARGTPPGVTGGTAFENSLIARFNTNYGSTSGTFWTGAPSNPTVNNLFSTNNTYTRPGTAYVALWQTLGRDRMISAMKNIQSTYGGRNITEPQLEDVFRAWLPVPSASCNARLTQFFTEWFDTAYPTGGTSTTNKPKITGPSQAGLTGMNGTGFVCAQVSPAAPNGQNGWYTGNVSLTWQGYATPAVTKTGCVDETISTDGTFNRSCSVVTTAAPILDSGPVSETIKRDATAPATAATLTPTAIGAWYSPRTVTLDASDATSGVASTDYRLDGGSWTPYPGTFFIASFGPHTLEFRSTDVAGNIEVTKTESWGDLPAVDQLGGLSDFVGGLGLDRGLTKDLQKRLADAAKKVGQPKDACGQLDDFLKHVLDEAGKNNPKLTVGQAEQLLSVNQIEALLGCIPAGSTGPAAERDLLELLQTIDGLGLDRATSDGLGNRVRDIGKQVAGGNVKAACHSLSDLSKKLADLAGKGKLSAAQAATLGDAVAQIGGELGC